MIIFILVHKYFTISVGLSSLLQFFVPHNRDELGEANCLVNLYLPAPIYKWVYNYY